MPNVNWDAYGYGGGGAPGFDESWLPHGQQPNVFDMTPDRSGTWNTQPSGASPLAPSSAAAPPQGGPAYREWLAQQYHTPDNIAKDYWAPDWKEVFMTPSRWGTSAPKPGAFDLDALGRAWVSSGGRTNQDWINFYNQHPEFAANGYTMQQGSKPGELIGPNGTGFDTVIASGRGGEGASWTPFGSSGGGGGNASDVYVNEILSRLSALHQPVNSPMNTLLQLVALNRVKDLGAAPYSSAEDAALVAKYRNPATQARDAALSQQQESLARYGYLPSSGLAQKQRADIQNTYQQGIAQASNDLAVRAVGQKQQNAQEQLAILASLMGNETSMRNEDLQRTLESVQTAQLLPQLQQSQLQSLITASNPGTDQTAALSALMQMLGLNQHQNQIDQGNQQANAAAWGQYLAYVLQNLPH